MTKRHHRVPCLCPEDRAPVHRGYSERYDARYCLRCTAWTESTCGDPDCYFCRDRPSDARDENEHGDDEYTAK